MTSRKRLKKWIKGSKEIKKEPTTTKRGSKEESGLTITNERGLKKERGLVIVTLREDRNNQ
jgi:hypothetical protein